METIQLKGNGAIREGRIELDVPHLGKTITYVLPLIGPNYHENVMQEIDSQKLLRPTAAQVFSLIDLALQNQGEPHCDEIVRKFRGNYLWTATEGLSYLQGHIAYDNVDGKMPQTSQGLLSLIAKKDSRVRQVQPGFKTGFFPLNEFIKHPVITAYVGEEMIPTVERVAKTLNSSGGYVYSLNKTAQDTKTLSAVGGYGGCWLGFLGDYGAGDDGGFASGVLASGEASAPVFQPSQSPQSDKEREYQLRIAQFESKLENARKALA